MRLLKPFSKTSIDELKDVERLQDTIENVVNGLSASPIVSGQLLKDIEVTTSAKRIEHKLGRAPLGFIVVKINANSVVFEQPETRPDLFLNLEASAAAKVSLWVF